MTNFKILKHLEIDEAYQGINLTEFLYTIGDYTNHQLIDSFIHSTHFTFDSLRDGVKKAGENNRFLRQAFETSFVSFNDFKHLTKAEIIKFLTDFSNEDDWGVDRNDFLVIKNKFVDLLVDVDAADFYLLNKAWFDNNDKRIRDFESDIYTYYFLILWLDTVHQTLTISEWAYD